MKTKGIKAWAIIDAELNTPIFDKPNQFKIFFTKESANKANLWSPLTKVIHVKITPTK